MARVRLGPRGHKAYEYDGVDDYGEAPLDMANLTRNKAFTVAAIVKWLKHTFWGKLISTDYRQDGTWSEPYVFFALAQWEKYGTWESFSPTVRKLDGSVVYPHVDTGIAVELNKWTFVVGRSWIEKTTCYNELWLDGEKAWSQVVEDVEDYDYGASDRIFLAVRSSFTKYEWGNQITALVAMFNVALTDSELNQLFSGHRVTRGLVLELLPQNIENGVWRDSSGYGNDATIYGAKVRWV